jgi:hypothetical protein
MHPVQDDGVMAIRASEWALFAGGALATVLVLVLAAWLFTKASREHREQIEREEREEREREAREKPVTPETPSEEQAP